MEKSTIGKATVLAMIALACSWGIPGVSMGGDDFLDRLKKAAEKAAQQRQQQSQPKAQQQTRQPSLPA